MAICNFYEVKGSLWLGSEGWGHGWGGLIQGGCQCIGEMDS